MLFFFRKKKHFFGSDFTTAQSGHPISIPNPVSIGSSEIRDTLSKLN